MLFTESFVNTFDTAEVRRAPIVRFDVPALRDDAIVEHTAHRLFQMADRGPCHLILNLEAVDDLTSDMLMYLLNLQRSLKARGGKLVLCQLNVELTDLFRRLSLDRFFTVCGDEEDAREHI